jgi:stage II sporulation protein AA (anti-sigma F factor antagonist)
MNIVETDAGGILVLEPVGSIDNTNAGTFYKQTIAAIQSRQGGVVIDFGKLEFISSAGFRSLLIIGKSASNLHRKLVLCCIGPEMRRLFDLASFDEIFVVCASRQEAAAKAS